MDCEANNKLPLWDFYYFLVVTIYESSRPFYEYVNNSYAIYIFNRIYLFLNNDQYFESLSITDTKMHFYY